jgi:hypothetical protein
MYKWGSIEGCLGVSVLLSILFILGVVRNLTCGSVLQETMNLIICLVAFDATYDKKSAIFVVKAFNLTR